ncbi:MAG: CoA-binding protein [Ignavibacteria bacterium]|nr:CoA-binding protein [Ignavibacteria bacterium]
MNTTIKNILASGKIGLIGISSNKMKFGNTLYKEISAKGYDVYPVSRNCDEVDGKRCLKDISELYGVVDSVIIATGKKNALDMVKKIEKGKIKNIWFAKGADTTESIAEAKAKNINVVSGYCPLMFMNPKGFHKFHEVLSKIFFLYPKNYN